MSKLLNMTLTLVITGLLITVGNMIGYKADWYSSLLGIIVIIAIGLIGMVLSQIPILNKLPMVFWISFVAVLASLPVFPGSEWIIQTTKKVQFLAITTPILAYAGLSLGKDIEMFKKLSWRIVPVALAVTTGTFIFAAIIAQFVLKWEGAI
jgi:energy-converting hydrogenase Eha subunit H